MFLSEMPTISRKVSQANGNGAVTNGEKKENTDFQFSMLKASLDYDTEIFGSNVSQHVIENNPLSRNISTLSAASRGEESLNGNSTNNKPTGLESFKRKNKKEKFQNCNSPGAMLAYAQYTQVIPNTKYISYSLFKNLSSVSYYCSCIIGIIGCV